MTPKAAIVPNNELTVRWHLGSNAKRDRTYPYMKENDTVKNMIKKDSNTKLYIPKWSATTYVVDTIPTDPSDNTKLYYVKSSDPQLKYRNVLIHEILLILVSICLNIRKLLIYIYIYRLKNDFVREVWIKTNENIQ